MSVSFDMSDFDKVTKNLQPQTSRKAVEAGLRVIEGNAVVNIEKNFSKQTGELAGNRSVEVKVEGENATGTLTFHSDHARIHELGGVIRPINKQMLSWEDGSGQQVFAKSVTIQPKPYLRPAVDEHQEEIKAAMAEQIRQGIERSKS